MQNVVARGEVGSGWALVGARRGEKNLHMAFVKIPNRPPWPVEGALENNRVTS